MVAGMTVAVQGLFDRAIPLRMEGINAFLSPAFFCTSMTVPALSVRGPVFVLRVVQSPSNARPVSPIARLTVLAIRR